MTNRPSASASLAAPSAAASGSLPVRADGRVTGRTLIMMRWIAVAGQLTSLALLTEWFRLDLPMVPVLATVGVSVLANIEAMHRAKAHARLTDGVATWYLAFDMVQLSLLLFLTGGMVNPFTILLLAPLTVGAAILSPSHIVRLSALNQVCLAVLAVWHLPLPWRGEPLTLSPLYLVGVWSGQAMAAALLAAYVFRVANESRRIGDALAASQLALAREQRLSALGGLAAAAAHELGTPLATIAVVATELAREVPPDSPLAEDVALLQSQSLRCRDILAELSRKPEADGGAPFERLPLHALIEAAASPHRAMPALLDIVTRADDGSAEPVLRRSPEALHGLGNLIQNALQFARNKVEVIAAWDRDTVTVTIADDGPGFPSSVLARMGEPYISARADRTGHMGLGIFIAQTLLGRTGARVEFGNRRQGGGAHVAVLWERAPLESEA